MCRYSPKIDLVFRKLFGSEENKDLLLDFLNSVLEGNIVIEKITLKNPYNLSDYINGKLSVLDVKAEDENGIWYDIEMQLSEQSFYGRRALYYWSKIYSEQIQSAYKYDELKKTIGIHLLDFDYFDDEKYFRRATIKDFDTNEIYENLDYMDLYFIEMSKFNKKHSELKTKLDQWITFLNEAYILDKENLPYELEGEKIGKAVEKLEIMYLDEKEKQIYEAKQKMMMDTTEIIRTAKEKGLEEGREEGREEGIEKGIEKGKKEAKIKTAKKMLLKNLDIEDISELTELSIEEIKKLK